MEQFLKRLGIKPNNISLYYQAVTHPTFANERNYKETYQRLEFMGDSLLQTRVSLYIYNNYPKMNEGEMTILRANNVNTGAFSKLSLQLGLDNLLRIGKGAYELKTNKSILADIFESFCAAIYFDQGVQKLDEILRLTVYEQIDLDVIYKKESKDSKTLLQEFLQSSSRKVIKYQTVKFGNEFKSIVYHDGNKFGKGYGKTKKEAELNAAQEAMSILGKVK